MALASKVAVVSNDPAQIEQSKGLQGLLETVTGSNQTVRVFIGNYDDIDEFRPDLVVDYGEEQLTLQAHARALEPNVQFRYSAPDLRIAQANAEPLREDPALTWMSIAKQLTEHFEWAEALAVYSIEKSTGLIQAFRDSIFTPVFINTDIQSSEVDLLVTRELRITGIRPIFILGGLRTTNLFLASLTKYEMDVGYAVILIGTNCQFDVTLYPNGVLCIVLEGAEAAESETVVDYWYTYYALANKPLETWSLVNVAAGHKHIVGHYAQGRLSINSAIEFPGGLSTLPIDTQVEIVVALISMEGNSFVNSQKAAPFALEDFHLSSKKFTMKLILLDICSLDPVDAGEACLAVIKANKVTLLLMNDITTMPLYIMNWQNTVNKHAAFISVIVSMDDLGDSSKYPNYVQIAQSPAYAFKHLALLVKSLKYTAMNLFVDPYFPDVKKQQTAALESAGVTVVTPDELIYYNSTDPDYCTKAAEQVKQSGLRPLMNYVFNHNWISCYFPALHKAGFSGDDLVHISLFGTFKMYDLLVKDEDKEAHKEMFRTTLSANFEGYKGDFGEKVKQKLAKQIPNIFWNDCFVYDTMAVAVTAVDFMLRRGLNFYDWQETIQAVRSVRLLGCSGAITFSKDHNYRRDIDAAYLQTQDVGGGELEDIKACTTSFVGETPFTIIGNFQWFDDTSDMPKQYRLNVKYCPFPEEYRRDSEKSQLLEARIVLSLFGISAGIALVTYFLVGRKQPMNPVESPVLLGTQDMIIVTSTLGEVAFIGLLTPKAGPLNFVLISLITQGLNFFDLGDGKIFDVLNATFAGISLTLLITGICALNRFRPFGFDVQVLAVFLVRTLFGLFVLVLFSVFDCSEAASATDDYDVQDSFMDVDCSETCWEGKHLSYSIASAVIFLVFVLVFIPASSLLSNTLEGLQFETNPAFLLIRIPFLTLFVALLKASPLMTSATHSVLYMLVLAVYAAACFKVKALAIPSLDFIHSASLLILLFVSLCQTLHFEVYDNYLAWVLISYLGIVVGVGLVYLRCSRLPTMILNPPKIDFAEMLKFAFRFNRKFDPAKIYEASHPRYRPVTVDTQTILSST
jgi:hypothetical protein